MSSQNNNNNNNKDKECIHEVLSETDLSCTVCGMSRYDQLQNKKRLTKRRKRIGRLCKSKTLGIDRLGGKNEMIFCKFCGDEDNGEFIHENGLIGVKFVIN